MEETENKDLRMKIEEMKMMLDMKILDDFIYEKKLEEKKIFGIENESSSESNDKQSKIKEIKRLMDDNMKKTIEYYNKKDEDNALDYRKIVSRYMDVSIDDVDITMINKMLEELDWFYFIIFVIDDLYYYFRKSISFYDFVSELFFLDIY